MPSSSQAALDRLLEGGGANGGAQRARLLLAGAQAQLEAGAYSEALSLAIKATQASSGMAPRQQQGGTPSLHCRALALACQTSLLCGNPAKALKYATRLSVEDPSFPEARRLLKTCTLELEYEGRMRDLVQSASAASNPCLQTPGGSGASTPVAVSANTTPRQSASGIEARIGPDAASSAAMPAVPHVSAGHTAGSAEAGNPSSPGLAALARVQQLIERLLWDEEDSVTGAPDDLLPPPPSALGAAGSGEEAGLPQSDQCDPPESSAGERDPKKSDPVPALQLLAETVGTSVDGQLAFVVAGGMPAVMAFFPSYPEQVERVLLAAGLCRLHHPSPLGTILTPTGQAPAPGRTVHSQQQQQQSQPQPQQQQQQAPLRVRWPRMVLQRLAGMALDWRSEPHLAEVSLRLLTLAARDPLLRHTCFVAPPTWAIAPSGATPHSTLTSFIMRAPSSNGGADLGAQERALHRDLSKLSDVGSDWPPSPAGRDPLASAAPGAVQEDYNESPLLCLQPPVLHHPPGVLQSTPRLLPQPQDTTTSSRFRSLSPAPQGHVTSDVTSQPQPRQGSLRRCRSGYLEPLPTTHGPSDPGPNSSTPALSLSPTPPLLPPPPPRPLSAGVPPRGAEDGSRPPSAAGSECSGRSRGRLVGWLPPFPRRSISQRALGGPLSDLSPGLGSCSSPQQISGSPSWGCSRQMAPAGSPGAADGGPQASLKPSRLSCPGNFLGGDAAAAPAGVTLTAAAAEMGSGAQSAVAAGAVTHSHGTRPSSAGVPPHSPSPLHVAPSLQAWGPGSNALPSQGAPHGLSIRDAAPSGRHSSNGVAAVPAGVRQLVRDDSSMSVHMGRRPSFLLHRRTDSNGEPGYPGFASELSVSSAGAGSDNLQLMATRAAATPKAEPPLPAPQSVLVRLLAGFAPAQCDDDDLDNDLQHGAEPGTDGKTKIQAAKGGRPLSGRAGVTKRPLSAQQQSIQPPMPLEISAAVCDILSHFVTCDSHSRRLLMAAGKPLTVLVHLYSCIQHASKKGSQSRPESAKQAQPGVGSGSNQDISQSPPACCALAHSVLTVMHELCKLEPAAVKQEGFVTLPPSNNGRGGAAEVRQSAAKAGGAAAKMLPTPLLSGLVGAVRRLVDASEQCSAPEVNFDGQIKGYITAKVAGDPCPWSQPNTTTSGQPSVTTCSPIVPSAPSPPAPTAPGSQSRKANQTPASLQILPEEDLPVAQPRFAAPKLAPLSPPPPSGELDPPKQRAAAAAAAASRLRPVTAQPSAAAAPRIAALSRPGSAAVGPSRSTALATAGKVAAEKSDASVTTPPTSLLERWLHVMGRVAASCRGAAKELFRSGFTTLLAEVLADFRASSHPVVLAAEEAWAQVVRNCQAAMDEALAEGHMHALIGVVLHLLPSFWATRAAASIASSASSSASTPSASPLIPSSLSASSTTSLASSAASARQAGAGAGGGGLPSNPPAMPGARGPSKQLLPALGHPAVPGSGAGSAGSSSSAAGAGSSAAARPTSAALTAGTGATELQLQALGLSALDKLTQLLDACNGASFLELVRVGGVLYKVQHMLGVHGLPTPASVSGPSGLAARAASSPHGSPEAALYDAGRCVMLGCIERARRMAGLRQDQAPRLGHFSTLRSKELLLLEKRLRTEWAAQMLPPSHTPLPAPPPASAGTQATTAAAPRAAASSQPPQQHASSNYTDNKAANAPQRPDQAAAPAVQGAPSEVQPSSTAVQASFAAAAAPVPESSPSGFFLTRNLRKSGAQTCSAGQAPDGPPTDVMAGCPSDVPPAPDMVTDEPTCRLVPRIEHGSSCNPGSSEAHASPDPQQHPKHVSALQSESSDGSSSVLSPGSHLSSSVTDPVSSSPNSAVEESQTEDSNCSPAAPDVKQHQQQDPDKAARARYVRKMVARISSGSALEGVRSPGSIPQDGSCSPLPPLTPPVPPPSHFAGGAVTPGTLSSTSRALRPSTPQPQRMSWLGTQHQQPVVDSFLLQPHSQQLLARQSSMSGAGAGSHPGLAGLTGLTGEQPKRRPYSGSSVSTYIRRAALEEVQAREALQVGGGLHTGSHSPDHPPDVSPQCVYYGTPSPPAASERRRPYSGSSIAPLLKLQQEQQERWRKKLLQRQNSLEGSCSPCTEGQLGSPVPSPRIQVESQLSPRMDSSDVSPAAAADGVSHSHTHTHSHSDSHTHTHSTKSRSRPVSAELVPRALMQEEGTVLSPQMPLRQPSVSRVSKEGSAGASAVGSAAADSGGADGRRSGQDLVPSPLQHAARMAWLDMPLSQRVGWSQTSESVSLTLMLPIGTTQQDVSVTITPTRLTISLSWAGRVVDGPLAYQVHADEAWWCIERDSTPPSFKERNGPSGAQVRSRPSSAAAGAPMRLAGGQVAHLHVLLPKAEPKRYWRSLFEGGEERGNVEPLQGKDDADDRQAPAPAVP